MMNVELGLPTLPCVLSARLMCEMESVEGITNTVVLRVTAHDKTAQWETV